MSDRDVLTQLLRQDLSSFIQKTFQTVSPADVYRHNWHIDAIAWAVLPENSTRLYSFDSNI